MLVISIVKNPRSFERIKLLNASLDNFFQFDSNYQTIEELHNVLSFASFGNDFILIADKSVYWKDEAISLLKENYNFTVVEFDKDFGVLEALLREQIPSAKPEEVASSSTDPVEETQSTEQKIQYVEKKVFEERVVIESVIESKSIFSNFESKIILIENLTPRSGSSFLALNLAQCFTDFSVQPSLLEYPKEGVLFDYSGIQRKMADHGDENSFISYPHIVKSNSKEFFRVSKNNIIDGVFYLVPDTRDRKAPNDWIIDSFSETEMMKLVMLCRKTPVTIIDVGNNYDKLQELYDIADMVLVVVDPLPHLINASRFKIAEVGEMIQKNYPYYFLINHYTKGVNIDDVYKFFLNPIEGKKFSFDKSRLIKIPDVKCESIHRAVFNYKIPYQEPDVKSVLEKAFSPIIKKILPSDILNSSSSFQNEKEKNPSEPFYMKLFAKKK